MNDKEKKAFVARMKKGKKEAAKGKSKYKYSTRGYDRPIKETKSKGGGKSKMIKVNKKALLAELNSLESDLRANVAERISPDIAQKSIGYKIKRMKDQIKKM